MHNKMEFMKCANYVKKNTGIHVKHSRQYIIRQYYDPEGL